MPLNAYYPVRTAPSPHPDQGMRSQSQRRAQRSATNTDPAVAHLSTNGPSHCCLRPMGTPPPVALGGLLEPLQPNALTEPGTPGYPLPSFGMHKPPP